MIKTLAQARKYVLKVKTCLIFGSKESALPSLWDAVDLPERVLGQKGWGEKVNAIWAWKNELPAQFPDEIFYGKLPDGLAMLMSLEHMKKVHYPAHHRSVMTCSPLAQKVFAILRSEPLTTAEVRKALSPSGSVSKSKIESALVELQSTLNITRCNAAELKRDTWVPFAEQYAAITS